MAQQATAARMGRVLAIRLDNDNGAFVVYFSEFPHR